MRVYDLNDLDNLPDKPQHISSAHSAASASTSTTVAAPARRGGHPLLWILTILLAVALVVQPLVQSNGVGIKDAQINEQGELVIYYTDGTQDNLGVVVGKNGMDGKDGVDGQDGTNGSSVAGSGVDTETATMIGLRSSVSIFCTFMEQGRHGVTEYYSAGSGVIYQINKSQGDAFIITNYHVVFDSDSRTSNGIAEKIQVYLYGSELSGMEMEATYVGGSMNYDIAILRIEDSELLRDSAATAIRPGNSDAVAVGSTAIAIGNPEGSGISASCGVVSVDSEHITMTAADGYTEVSFRVMRIDTAVNSGNSGGGLFDKNGRLIGIVNAKTITDGVENIGYALPSTTVFAVADNIIDYCFGTDVESVQRPILGVTVITKASSGVYNEETGMVDIRETVEIYEVSPNQIGSVLQVGDVLQSVKLGDVEKEITRQHHIIDLLLTARVGDEVQITVLRDGQSVTLNITITESCLTAS